MGRVVFARTNLAAPVCSGQLGGRSPCFRFAVLAWRRVGAELGQFLAEHDDLRRSLDPQADAAVGGGLHHGDPNGLTDEDAFADLARKGNLFFLQYDLHQFAPTNPGMILSAGIGKKN